MVKSAPIKVSEENWKRLNAMKDPGDTFDDVVGRLLDQRVENDELEA